jgi:hypothetical protein
MKFIYMPLASKGVVGISYIGELLRNLLDVILIFIGHNRSSNYQLQCN